MSKVKRICRHCGGGFMVCRSKIKDGRGKYCSNRCKGLSQRKRVKNKCKTCGKEFDVRLSGIKRGWGKYCSPKCYGLSKRTRVKKKCWQCGGVFETNPSQIKNGRGRYCSKKCAFDSGLSTTLEIKGRSILNDLELEFEEQYKVGPYLADVFIPESNLIIEWDGDYWHNLKDNIARDKRKDKYYTEQGFTVLRFWEHEVYDDTQSVIDEIIYITKKKIISPKSTIQD